MRVLLTGANGYIGLRILPDLLEAGHTVIALVRDLARFPQCDFMDWEKEGKIQYIEADFLKPETLPDDLEIDAAYYLLHSMGGAEEFAILEKQCATHFSEWVEPTGCQQVIYLGGLTADGDEELSQHMSSRQQVGEILSKRKFALTTLKASIIVGSGSASFEIIRDLSEKLPIMLTPKWTKTRCQPIAIRNVTAYLTGVLGNEKAYHQKYDIGGPEVLTYKTMLETYAKVRQLKRFCLPIPLLSPKLSSYWLYYMTSTSFSLAKSLVASLHIETICQDNSIRELIPQKLLSYEEAIEMALSRIAQNRVPSAWYDSLSSTGFAHKNLPSIHVPEHGVFTDTQAFSFTGSSEKIIESVWSLGGKKGWPSMDWAWKIRGVMDRIVGGIGIRRGRRHPNELREGDGLDFWRVILADKERGRLILYAEMKLPGEAWLEFEVIDSQLKQTATFRPRGLFGRLYWWGTYPFHLILFPLMVKRLSNGW